MGKSPAKWIKTVLLGKKSSKSGSTKTNESKAADNNGNPAGEERELPGNSPVISQPVLVTVHKSAVSADGKSENSNLPSDQAEHQGLQNQSSPDPKPVCPGEPVEEQAAVKAQAAFRGHLARRSFRTLKGIVRLQALIRGHLVRRQAMSTLRTTWLIVKFQAIVRGRNVRLSGADTQFSVDFNKLGASDAWKEKLSSNVYIQKLLSSPISPEPLHFRYDKRDPNSVYNWLERWTISRIWKPASQPKRVADGKPQVRKANYAMETESAKLKRNARKGSSVTSEGSHTSMAVESEKLKRNPRKFSNPLSDSVPDSQLSELEKVKRNLRKATNSMVEASKLSSVRADSSKVSDSIADAPKVSNAAAEASKITSLMNGMSDHQDTQCEKALQNTHETSFLLGPQEHSDNDHLLECSDIDNFNLLPGLKSDLETPLDSVSVRDNVDGPTADAPAVEIMPPQNTDNEDYVLRKKEEVRSKEEHQSEWSFRASKRKSSFSNKSEHVENGTRTTPVQPRQPSYMAPTESLKAKLRTQNSPRLDSDSSAEKNGFPRRHSLPSSTNNRAIKAEWKR